MREALKNMMREKGEEKEYKEYKRWFVEKEDKEAKLQIAHLAKKGLI